MNREDGKQTPVSRLGLVFLGAYILLILFIRLKLPNAEAIIAIITDLYQQYGYAIVFLSGIIEAMFLLGMYFPGSAAILLGAVVARSGVVSLPLIILCGTVGLLLGYTINYFLGKYGWYHVLAKFGLEKGIVETEKKLTQHGIKALALGYISPNSGALISTAAGVMNMPFKKFLLLSIVCQLFWSSVWGIIAYLLGTLFVELFLKYFTFVVWGIIILFLVKGYLAKRKSLQK